MSNDGTVYLMESSWRVWNFVSERMIEVLWLQRREKEYNDDTVDRCNQFEIRENQSGFHGELVMYIASTETIKSVKRPVSDHKSIIHYFF